MIMMMCRCEDNSDDVSIEDAVSVCWMAVRYEHPSLYSGYPVSIINDVNTVVIAER